MTKSAKAKAVKADVDTPMLFPDLMTPGEVAAAFHVDLKTVARWENQGQLEAIRTPGGHRRFLTASVQSFFKSRYPKAKKKHIPK